MKNVIKSLTAIVLLTSAAICSAATQAEVAKIQQMISVSSNCSAQHNQCVSQCMQNPSPYGKASCIAHCPPC